MNRLTWIAALAMTGGLLLSACGGVDDETVLARNLASGEIQSFPKDQVPADWMVCTSLECPVPPTVTCQKLGAKVCTLNPECRLKELWCQGEGCACPACAPGTTCPPCNCPPPKPPVCEYTCIPKLPLLCEELSGEKQCGARTDCEWAEAPCACPAICEDDGKGGCKPCPPCAKTCRAKAPSICQQLDEKTCATRSDCQWDILACAAVCQDDGKGGCLPCPNQGVCNPKTPLPPPCPELAPPPPGYCAGGKIIVTKDKNGCMTSFTCELPNQKSCSDLNVAYIAAVGKAKVCNPYSMMPVQECGTQVDSELFCPICPAFVSIFATAAVKEMDDLRAKFIAAGCDQMEIACPANACQAPKSATCLPSSAGGGICTPDAP
jgi:hypothetical protein